MSKLKSIWRLVIKKKCLGGKGGVFCHKIDMKEIDIKDQVTNQLNLVVIAGMIFYTNKNWVW